jgi:ATP-dependent exoDNAse (exonuclease V) alpha subunit
VQARIDLLRAEVDRWEPRAGRLIIVDEASLAATFALDELVGAAHQAGAKVLLVGDGAQLTGIEAGGMFATLAAERGSDVAHLSDVRRFSNRWEKSSSVELRAGREAAVDAYLAQDRVVSGSRTEILDAVYQAWKHDTDTGMTSLMIAPDTATVSELNARARAERLTTGDVEADGVNLAGGQTAGVGDLVITRQNNRLLTTGRSWVKNGDCWTVTATHPAGTMTVARHGGSQPVVLPADYVAQHVELGYAATTVRRHPRS